jgi:phage repressor protein C with HTH and peptisase S24 domain
MEPGLREGDRLLVSYAASPRPDDRVLVAFPDGTLAVKRAVERRATRTGAPGWWVLSDNPGEGVDSRHRGVLPADAVRGVVRLRVWPVVRR